MRRYLISAHKHCYLLRSVELLTFDMTVTWVSTLAFSTPAMSGATFSTPAFSAPPLKTLSHGRRAPNVEIDR